MFMEKKYVKIDKEQKSGKCFQLIEYIIVF